MDKTKSYLIYAVDGGGSSCRVEISRGDGRVLASYVGGPANFASDPDLAIRNVLVAVESAEAMAGLDRAGARCAMHVGLAGVLSPEDEAAVVGRMPFDACSASDDRLTTIVGAVGDGDGVALSVGTGSFVGAVRAGAARFVGGWGLALGDQGSGAWLGREALTVTLLACDGLAAESKLTTSLLAKFGDAPIEIVGFAKAARPVDFGRFAPLVTQAALAGDVNGLALMRKAGAYFNQCLETVGAGDGNPICVVGGLGTSYLPYLDSRFRDHIRPANGSALDGARLLARRNIKELEALA